MGALIDSSVLIAAERGQLDLDSRLDDHSDEDFALRAMTASELLHGVHRADTNARRTRREAYVEALLAGFPVIPFDLAAARMHARLEAVTDPKQRTRLVDSRTARQRDSLVLS